MFTSKIIDYYLFDVHEDNALFQDHPKKICIHVAQGTVYETVLQIAKKKSMMFDTTSVVKHVPYLKYHTTLKSNENMILDK